MYKIVGKLIYLALVLLVIIFLSSYALTMIAILITSIAISPLFLTKKWDIFSPWTYTLYYIILNVLIRSIFIDFEIANNDVNFDAIYYLGKDKIFLIESSFYVLTGVVFLVIGYITYGNRIIFHKNNCFNINNYSIVRYEKAIKYLLLISISASFIFIYLTLGNIVEFQIEQFSKHRGLSDDLEEYNSYGYLRLLIGLSSIVVYLSYIQIISNSNNRLFNTVAMALSFLIYTLMSFYSQSRAAIVIILLNLIFINYYINNRKFPWKLFLSVLPISIILFSFASAFRYGSGISFDSNLNLMTILAPIILNNGGIDISKTGHVIYFVDKSMDYKFGSTLVEFMIAVIPRLIWSSKPVNLDTYIGENIYGSTTYGSGAVPPGFFAEMYMNFGLMGIIIGCLLLGFVMRNMQNILIKWRMKKSFIIIYVTCFQAFGMSVLGSGFSSTVMGVLMTLIPLFLVFRYIALSETEKINLSIIK